MGYTCVSCNAEDPNASESRIKSSQEPLLNFFSAMENPTRTQEADGNLQLPTSGSFDPFSPAYTLDFDNLLGAHNPATTHSLSPSASFHEHLSPDMLSDSTYTAAGQYSSPLDNGAGDEHITSEQFNQMLSLSGPNAMSSMNFDPSNVDHTQYRTLGVPQPQNSNFHANGLETSSAILSSVEDQGSSLYAGNQRQVTPRHLSPSQGSPAGSISSRQIISPIVRVESYEEGTQQNLGNNLDFNINWQSSNNHLSPYPSRECESDENEEGNWPPNGHTFVGGELQRHEDGSWPQGPSGQSGLSPSVRDEMKDLQVPSLDELQEQRHLAEKNATVQNWLAVSGVGDGSDESRDMSLASYQKSGGRRRAKSTNDLGVFNAPDDSLVPGPGAFLNVPSDYEDDDDFSASDEPESPPAQIEMQNHESYFPSLSEESLASGPEPWVDPPSRKNTNEKPYQPPTANMAMMRFKQRAKDIESASLAATLGSESRRRSESDLGSVLTAKGISRDLSAQSKEKPHRMESLLQKFTPRRVNSNQRKRKGTVTGGPSQVHLHDGSSGTSTPKDAPPAVAAPKRMGSWSKTKGPKLDTSPAVINPPTSNSDLLTVTSPSTPWGMAKNVIRRSRSRSDIGRSRSKSDSGRSPGLGELMTQIGGPPMPKLVSPSGAPQGAQANALPSNMALDLDDDSGDEFGALSGGITMDLAVRADPIIPTFEGFYTQARQLNPRIPEYLLERVTKEQQGRYQRLVNSKQKHVAACKAKSCSSKEFCSDLGGTAKQLKPRVGNKETDTAFQGFQIIKPGMSAESIEKESEGTLIAAAFPSGVPLPPVDRLPAEFECPLCFKVKKFWKPSDWTKHVHEDVQPFTCTFPTCSEPKSFKRKADWVRHENERHRQLENWTCDIGECVHTCYRKDNFVQHLVREHKIPEPGRGRTGKGAGAASRSPISPMTARNWGDSYTTMPNPPGFVAEDIWQILDRCRRDTTKQPQEEPCRFCGNICNNWKKLTVHLAKHMEQISMPILPLIEARQVDGAVEPASLQLPQAQRSTGALTDSPQALPTFLTDEPLPLDMDLSQASVTPGISVNGSQVMHTFPPPQYHPNLQYGSVVPQNAASFDAPPTDTNFPTRTYPGLPATSRQPTPSSHSPSPYASSVQGTSYPPPRSVPGNYPQQHPTSYAQQQTFQPPAESNGFGGDALHGFMMPHGNIPVGQSVPSNLQAGAQQNNNNFNSGFDQNFMFPSQQYSNYGYGGASG